MRLFGPFIALILIEIALFITLGGAIGLLPSLAVIFGTGVLGVAVMRRQGRRAALDLRAALDGIRKPTAPPADVLVVFLAGLLLVSPGFLADALGLLLLIPPLRRALIAMVAKRMPVQATAGFGVHQTGRPDVVIDGEFIEIEQTQVSQDRGPSGWTKP
ncbi:MAG: FxsA family protein [Gemmobacter sp.]|nr:FxsA family protein [Gemmobacter sp.]